MISSHDLLGFVIPTNEPKTAHKLLIPTIHYFSDLACYSTIIFNFQEPWDQFWIDNAVKICVGAGFNVKYAISDKYDIPEKGHVPFNQIRYDAAILYPYCKFYVLMDDDFSFLPMENSDRLASRSYLEALHYMMTNPDCGSILMKGGLYRGKLGVHQVMPINDLELKCITDKGIILRRIDGGLVVPDDAVELIGCDEEKIAVAWRVHEGYYPAVMNYIKLNHYENDIKNGGVIQSGQDMYGWNNKKIVEENATKYIRDHFYPEFINNGPMPTKLNDPTKFKFDKGIKDYNGISTDQLKSEINTIMEEW